MTIELGADIGVAAVWVTTVSRIDATAMMFACISPRLPSLSGDKNLPRAGEPLGRFFDRFGVSFTGSRCAARWVQAVLRCRG